MPKGFFTTSDLALAGFLRLQNYLIARINNQGGRAIFSFQDDAKREGLVLRFFNKETTCEPLSLLEEIRNLKSLIRQNGVSVGPKEGTHVGGDRR